jgi:uncharacterized ferritin-like protein (DUF455 family)
MELRALAERILFATTIEDKLHAPEVVTDEQPGPALPAPAAPGRPRELQFKPQTTPRADFPSLDRLEQAAERGRLLHFFANHELLATELMALVLLRFPEAPTDFRRGVLNTLRDEQAHTRWYVERMRACGVTFGELPVSGYFWRCVAPMENPMDYVAGLCLTFEQANLDFARHFARGFATVGDAASADLLERIYRDEIGHVAYGLKWFRRWKQPTESDWEAFCRTLKFPLSPQRAKGFTVNVAGRRAAGLDPAFIAELEVYSHSRGRTPGVYVFNPFTESFLAVGKGFTPTRHQTHLARDLACLPQFLCREDDVVLVPERPAIGHLSQLKRAGFALPEFVALEPAGTAPGVASLASRKLGSLRPWAWGPDSVELLAPLFHQVSGEPRAPGQRFNAGLAQLYAKSWSAEFLRRFLVQSPPGGDGKPWAEEEWLCNTDEVGAAVDSVEAALAAIAAVRQRGHQRVVVKQDCGLAGQSALRLWEPAILAPQRRWLERAMAQGGVLVVEPWLERVVDFSAQLEMGTAGLKLCGYTGLLCDLRGQFQGNWAESHHHRRLPAEIAIRLAAPPDIARRLPGLYAAIFGQLETELRRLDFIGPLGVDAFVYRTPAGRCRLKPVVEINPRCTMGRVLVELMRRTVPGSFGRFRLVGAAQARAAGAAGFVAYARTQSERLPVQLEGEPLPRLREGFVCLNDPAAARVCLAVFEVRRNPF